MPCVRPMSRADSFERPARYFNLHARFAYALTPERYQQAYKVLRQSFGGVILLGLEILVAADLVRTVAVEPTLDNVVILGLIVLIRTMLSFSLEIEIEGVAPWRRAAMTGNGLARVGRPNAVTAMPRPSRPSTSTPMALPSRSHCMMRPGVFRPLVNSPPLNTCRRKVAT